MTERLLSTPRKSRDSGPQHPHMNEFNIIQLRAKQASQFYNSIGLSNGDLPRDVAAVKNERKRWSGSPEKKRPVGGPSGISTALSQPSTPASTPSKYGATWLEPSKPIINEDTDSKVNRFKLLPNKYNIEHSNEASSDKQRSKSSSQGEGFLLSPVNFRQPLSSASSADDSLSQDRRNRLSPRRFYDNNVNLKEPPKTTFRSYDYKKDDSAFLKQDLRVYQTNGFDNETTATRVSSHLHEKLLSTIHSTPERKPKADFTTTSTPTKRSSNDQTAVSNNQNTISGTRKKLAGDHSIVAELTGVFTNSSDSSPAQPFHFQRQRSLSDTHSSQGDHPSSSCGSCAPPPSFLHSKKAGSTSSLNESKTVTDANMLGLVESYRNNSCQTSPTNNQFKKTKIDTSPIQSDGEIQKRFHRFRKTKSKSDVPDHRVILDSLHQERRQREARDRATAEQAKQRRRFFAHYDWQSILFSFQDSLSGMDALKRKNTPSGASKVAALAAVSTDSLASKGSSTGGSQEDVSVEADEGLEANKHNILVDSCPFFRNEIGGEIDRDICISAPSGLSVQVGNDNNETITEAHNVLPNHSYLSIVERGNSGDLMPPNSPPRGSVCFGIENVDGGASYYRKHFYEKEHLNFLGIDEKYGPIVISFRREKVDERSTIYQYRIIVRTCELRTLRGSILEDAILPTRNPPIKGYHAKDVLEYVFPELNTSCLKVGLPIPKVQEQLMKIDEQNVNDHYKVGVLYCRAGQTTEDDMYNNEHGSEAFHQFLNLLGKTVKLNGFDDYKGGLDVKTDSTGTESVFTTFSGFKIMFHVSTLLPFTPSNRQQLLRKRHIGNDIVTIVFQEPGSEPFNPKHIRSHFQHVFIIVRVHHTSNGPCYSVAVTRSRNIPRFGPPIPENSMFPASPTFRDFLLTKVVNGENIAHNAGKFRALAMNTREQYLRDMAVHSVTQSGLEGTPRLGRFSLTAASRRIKEGKEKQKTKPPSQLWGHGAIAWNITVHDYSLSEAVPCYVAVSNCVLSIIEVETKQLIFSIPCQAVLGWGVPPPTPDQLVSHIRELHVYYGKGERLSLEIDDAETRSAIVSRLEFFTKGTETKYRQLHRNKVGELGFRVNYEGVVVELKPEGYAAADGLKQSSRLVEICKIAVATLMHDEINDLLRTSTVVTVVAIPPNDDGTPRKCSMELYHLYPVLEIREVDLRIPPPGGIAHERCRSEPVDKAPLSDRMNSSRRTSEDGRFPVPRYQYEDQNETNQSSHMYDRRGRVKVQRPALSKSPSGNHIKATLAPSSTRQAMASENGLQPNNFNSLPHPHSNPGYRSNHINSDWVEAGLHNRHTVSNNSLSSDSGLNSNNNSSYSSTLSRCSNNAAASSNQQIAFNEILETKFLQQNNNNNNNNNNAASVSPSPLETRQTLPRSNPPIRGVLWNSTRTTPGCNVSRTMSQPPSSEHYQSNLPIVAANSDSLSKLDSIRALEEPSTSHQHYRSDLTSSSLSSVKQPVPTPRSFKKTPSPSPRTYTSNPRNKRTITDVPPSPGLMESLRSSSTNLSSIRTPTDVHSTIIRMFATEKINKTLPGTSSRKSPVRFASQRVAPDRRMLFPSGSPTRPLHRTVSDESLCGARTEALHGMGQESSGLLDSSNEEHNRLMSASVDSLATSPLRLKLSPAKDALLSSRSPIRKVSSFPLPMAPNWDQILDAAKAAEAFEASSIRSASMGTLTDLQDMTSDPLRSLNRGSGKRTVSVEHLYDHANRPTLPFATRTSGSQDMKLDLMSRSLTRHSSKEEERLERIEKKLRSLQQQLKQEQSSKKQLEKEVTSLRRDNTLLLRHVRGSKPDIFSEEKPRKSSKEPS